VIHYLDTSALVKAYVAEVRSDDVLTLLQQTRAPDPSARVFVSRLAYPEAASAIARRERDGSLTATEAQRLYRELDADFTGPDRPYELIEASPAVVNQASALVRRFRLRGFDAVHLSCALLLSGAVQGRLTFVCADRALLEAAKNEASISVLDLSQ
jgi:predicted nucleic acid-binding protein